MLPKKRMNKLAVGVGIFSAVGLAVFAAGIYINGIQANSIGEEGRIAGLHFEKAIKLLKLESFQDAIVQYEKVVKLLPESRIAQDAQYWIGQSYFRMGEFKEALSVFEKLIKDFPGSAIVPVTNLMLTRVQKFIVHNIITAQSYSFFRRRGKILGNRLNNCALVFLEKEIYSRNIITLRCNRTSD